MSNPMPNRIEAEYESGYILREDDNDHSPYDRGMNVFNAILNRRAESVHGPMVRYSCVTPTETHSIDWTTLPDNARPIHFRGFEQDIVGGVITDTRIVRQVFGYQYTDENGKNHKEIKEII